MRATRWAIAAAVLLSLPSIGSGYLLDDSLLAGSANTGGAAWDLFDTSRMGPGDAAREHGWVGWWASPDFHVSFFRPLSSLSHAVEYRLWPQAPWAMHALNIALYAALVAAVCATYRQLRMRGPEIAWGGVLFAVSAAHAQSVGFISARNTLLATLFGVLAIAAHDRWRRDAWRAGALAGPALFACGLLSSEVGLCAAGYLLAYELLLDPARPSRRALALLPYLAIGAAWFIMYRKLGYGARGTGLYLDVAAHPLALAEGALRNTILLTAGELTVPVVMPLVMISFGLAMAAALVALFGWLLWPLLRRDPLARFFAAGMLASAAPFGATVAQDRLMLPLSLGAFGLIARLAASAPADARSLWGRRLLIGLHAAVAPLLFVPSLFWPVTLVDRHARKLMEVIPDAPLVVVLNAPAEGLFLYPEAMRRRERRAWPEHVYPLYAGDHDLRVERVASNAVELEPVHGWIHGPFELFARPRDLPFHAGERVALEQMTVEVLAVTPDGRPARARFTFARDLSGIAWVAWQGERPAGWKPPPLGAAANARAEIVLR
jgi:hypothetical protein